MTTKVSIAETNQSTVDQLRAATQELHLRLHDHPLLVELLTRPTCDCYRAVLEAFLRFYQSSEPALVASASQYGVAEQYPQSVRTNWLIDDLESLGGKPSQRATIGDRCLIPKLSSIEEFAGCLYVIKGSALGGQSILRPLNGKLPIDNCCRYFTADGAATRQHWMKFQRFCNQACNRPSTNDAALRAAKETFVAIETCLTAAIKGRQSMTGDN